MDFIEIGKVIYNFFEAVGIDIIAVICIVVLTQAFKKHFKWTSKTAFIVMLSVGTVCGLLKIIFGQVKLGQYLTALFGYPGISILLYMALKFFMPKLKEKFLPSVKNINDK